MDKVGTSIESDRDIEICECGRRRTEVCVCRWQLVLGVDFTASNQQSGKSRCDQGLHDFRREAVNPYLQAMSVVAMLSVCGGERDRCRRPILAYGFGDARTTSRAVFAFSETEQALGPVEVAVRYRSVAQTAQPGGPSSLAPLIRQTISKRSESSERHALLVLACGDLPWSALQDTKKAVAEASVRGITIAVLGVGDGRFDRMERLCRESPCIRFAKFQDVASHFPFGRLEAAQEIHNLLTARTEPLGVGQVEEQAASPSSYKHPVPLCPPDALVQGNVALVAARAVREERLWRTFNHAVAALSASLLIGAVLAGGLSGGSRKAITFCFTSMAVGLLRKRFRLIDSIR